MTTYLVTSSRLGLPEGATVTDGDLDGCNVAALVAAGHLTAAKPPSSKPTPEPAVEAATSKEQQ